MLTAYRRLRCRCSGCRVWRLAVVEPDWIVCKDCRRLYRLKVE